MADIILFAMVGGIAILAFAIFYLFIYPNMGKKPVSAPQQVPVVRPARSYILDTTKNKFGWGEVVGKTVLSRDRTAFKIETPEGTYNVSYSQEEIVPMNIFNSVAGEGPQTFTIRETGFNLNQEILREDVRTIMKELKRTREEADFKDTQFKGMRSNLDMMTDERTDLLIKNKEATQPKTEVRQNG